MCRTASIEGYIPVEEMPKSLLVTCYDGHLFSMDINRYNGRVIVRYPRDIESLQVIGKCFALLDSVSLFDEMRVYPERFLDYPSPLLVMEEASSCD